MPFERLDRKERISLACIALGLLTCLGIAAWLTPDPSGQGTHQQLGLPPCTSVSLLAMRCPACGMTTSWALMIRGRASEALQTNIGGSLLFLVAFFSVPWIGWILWTGSRNARDQWGLFALSGSITSLMIAVTLWTWGLINRWF